jgi:phenylpropionate dioxygenase-like ring-hydroxylating dioxygenase large terminal subunit
MTKMGKIAETAEDLIGPVTVPAEAYVSQDYARAEQDRLWRKTWLQAGRIEEIPEVGSYITYDIGVDSVIITRTGPDEIRAYHNVCPHRGRRLIDTPPGQHHASGKRMSFVCGFHAWTFNLEGRCTYIEHQDDWQGALTEARTSLGKVQVDTWGGWAWINLDPDCAPLRAYLDPIPAMLDPFEPQNMRFRWRKWIIFNCNWKVAMEAFAETYHVSSTHPEFMEFGQFRGWARNHGLHTNIGYEAPKDLEEDAAKLRLGTNGDPRITTAELQNYTWENANTNTTQTLVDAANRLKDELPEGTPGPLVFQHWLKSAREHDAARGVVWPVVEPAHTAKAGTAWQVFPNFQIGQAVNNMLCYGAKPYGGDPDMCIFEAAVYELFPPGGEPPTQWEYTKAEDWPPVLQQDFNNMAAVQQGMKNVGFRGTQPNPYMERSIASLHYNLAQYMGTGAPRSIT